MRPGKVFWRPPNSVFSEFSKLQTENPAIFSKECHDFFGIEEFRKLLQEKKLPLVNGLIDHDVIITNGGNPAFSQIVRVLCNNEGDSVLCFDPFYFNHNIALQLAKVNILHYDKLRILDSDIKILNSHQCGPFSEEDIQYLEDNYFKKKQDLKLKFILLCSPSNPTGYVIKKELMQKIEQLCEKYDIMMVIDEAYEFFFYGNDYYSPKSKNCIHLFSFSKTFDMGTHRVGYISFPKQENHEKFLKDLKNVPNDIPFSADVSSQYFAYFCTKYLVSQEENSLFKSNISSLVEHRDAVWDKIPQFYKIGNLLKKPEAGIYFFIPIFVFHEKIETKEEEDSVLKIILEKFGLDVMGGSVFSCPGYIRVNFAYNNLETTKIAAERLGKALDFFLECEIEFNK